MLTIPLVLPLVDNSWRWCLAIWGIPLVLIAILTVALVSPSGKPACRPRRSRAGRWWPDWSNKLIWQLGVPVRQRQQRLFLQQRLPARPSHRRRPSRPDRRRAHRAQFRPAAGVVCVARDRRQARASRLAVRPLRRADSPVPRRHRHHGERMDSVLCRRARVRRRSRCSPWLCAAAALERAGRRGADVGGDVHHQLQRRPRGLGAQRRGLGPWRQPALCLPADRAQRVSAPVRARGDPFPSTASWRAGITRRAMRPPQSCRHMLQTTARRVASALAVAAFLFVAVVIATARWGDRSLWPPRPARRPPSLFIVNHGYHAGVVRSRAGRWPSVASRRGPRARSAMSRAALPTSTGSRSAGATRASTVRSRRSTFVDRGAGDARAACGRAIPRCCTWSASRMIRAPCSAFRPRARSISARVGFERVADQLDATFARRAAAYLRNSGPGSTGRACSSAPTVHFTSSMSAITGSPTCSMPPGCRPRPCSQRLPHGLLLDLEWRSGLARLRPARRDALNDAWDCASPSPDLGTPRCPTSSSSSPAGITTAPVR